MTFRITEARVSVDEAVTLAGVSTGIGLRADVDLTARHSCGAS